MNPSGDSIHSSDPVDGEIPASHATCTKSELSSQEKVFGSQQVIFSMYQKFIHFLLKLLIPNFQSISFPRLCRNSFPTYSGANTCPLSSPHLSSLLLMHGHCGWFRKLLKIISSHFTHLKSLGTTAVTLSAQTQSSPTLWKV